MKPNRQFHSADVEKAQIALYEAVLSLKSTDEARDFFNDLCTPAELQALTDRWMVVEPLMQGETYRDIAGKTGVSVTTVGRVARFLTQGSGGYQRVFERIKKEAKKKRLKNK